MTNILVIDGHPDAADHLCHALARSYAEGARQAGHETRLLRLADAEIAFLRTADDFNAPPQGETIVRAREDITWSEHVVLIFPLWLGAAPALVKAFLEQTARAGFFAEATPSGPRAKLKGKSARIVVTMGMPSFFYRVVYGGFGVRNLARSVLGFGGISPIRTTMFGGVGAAGNAQARNVARMRFLGQHAA